MTKIFAISDFHGQLSDNLINKIKKENPNFIFSSGDFCGNKLLGKLFFKYAYGKSEDEIPEKIKKEINRLEKLADRSGKDVISKLKSLNIPIYAIRGNWDPAPFGHDLSIKVDSADKKAIKLFEKLQNKNFQFVDLRELEFEDFILVGGASSTSPQRVKKDMISYMIKKHNMSYKESKEFVSHLKKDWNFRQKNYEIIFEKAIKLKKQTGKKIIFLTHNCPYNTKLDKIKHGSQKGKHYGSYQEMLLIKKYQPDFVICGHMHENFGTDKISKSIIYNTGSAMDGKFKILEI
jgi:Icc-related predicted phosphoesterase